jgi:membrane protease YdiL (CAAX protease family)
MAMSEDPLEGGSKNMEGEEVPNFLLNSSLYLYSFMTAIAMLLCHFGNENFDAIIRWSFSGQTGAVQGGVMALLGAGTLLVLVALLGEYFSDLRSIYEPISSVLGQMPLSGIFYLSIFSSLGEEFLFRGAIQPALGLALTTLLFTLLHMNYSSIVSAWTFVVIASGGMLGALFEWSGVIWPAIICHFIVNFVMLVRFRYQAASVCEKRNRPSDERLKQEKP